MRIQLLVYGSLELAKIARLTTSSSEFLPARPNAYLSLAADCLLRKAEAYQQVLTQSLSRPDKVVAIRDLQMYKELGSFDSDREYMKKIASLEEIPSFKDAKSIIPKVLQDYFLNTPHNTFQLSVFETPSSSTEIMRICTGMIKECLKSVDQAYSLGESRFSEKCENHHLLLTMISQDLYHFGPVLEDPKSLYKFDWQLLTEKTLLKSVGVYRFKRIEMPEEDTKSKSDR